MDSDIILNKKQIKQALKSEIASAKAANLIYITDNESGIIRERIYGGFKYTLNGKEVTDTDTILRIKSLSIPPAWENVWICANPNGHLQATGYDTANRKQYRYHPQWNAIRKHTKFYRLLEFGETLPLVRSYIQNELKKPALTRDKILAVIISILDTVFLRIGNQAYEKLNGSYGLTTLKNKHVKIEGASIKFCFIGKKGIKTNISLRSRRLSNIIKQCKEIPGKQLFGYFNDAGVVSTVDSGSVNQYLKEISGKDFTAKDFRTWAGTVTAIKALRDLGEFTNKTEFKKNINNMYEIVAEKLGNTSNVCKKHYVHPIVVRMYEQKKFNFKYQKTVDDSTSNLLKPEEIYLIDMLS